MLGDYIKTIHKRSPRHKKSLALLISGGFTLFVFAFWLMAIFPPTSANLRMADVNDNNRTSASAEITPFQSFGRQVAAVAEAFNAAFNSLFNYFDSIDWTVEYREMRDNALKIYDR